MTMDKAKKKNIKRIISLVCIVAVVAVLAAMPLIAGQAREDDGPQASILSAAVQTGSIETVLLGGGTLTQEEALTVSVPSAVKLTEFLVSNGEAVKQGDPIANVDRVTVMTAIADVQETLEYLDEQIEEQSEADTDAQVEALAGGTVKILYAQEGEAVQDVMLRDGALAVLSLDGRMAVDISAETDLKAGSAVTVTFADETQTEGKLESNLAGELTVTVEDDDYAVGETVTVSTEDGVLGSGALYIFSPWNATAYTGTVEDIRVDQGETVDAGDTLMELENVGDTAAYRQLVAQRQAYEELMLELFVMYQTQQLTAPCDGVVSGVDENSAQLLADNGSSFRLSLLANAPGDNPDGVYSGYVGQVSGKTDGGLQVMVNPNPVTVGDYKTELNTIPTDTSAMTDQRTYSGSAPVYALSGGEWVQIGSGAVNTGDILLFAHDTDGNFVWVVRLIAGSGGGDPGGDGGEDPDTPTDPDNPGGNGGEDPDTPTDPDNPGGNGGEDPNTPTDPTDPNNPGGGTDPNNPGTTPGGTTPSGPSGGTPSGSFPSGGSFSGGSFSYSYGGSWSGSTMPQTGSYGSYTETEPEYELYGMDMTTVASVTPQENMTLQITVDELDVTRLALGMEAQVKVEALGGEKFTATVTEISNTGENSGGNSKFTVTLTMARGETMLAGMNGTVSIVLETALDVLTVPVEALVEEGTQTLIYTGYDEENELLIDPVEVTTGVSDGERVQILGGLSEGVTCYYAYYDTLEISYTPDFAGGGFMFG